MIGSYFISERNPDEKKPAGDKNLKVPRLIFIAGLLSVILVAVYANYSLNQKDKYRFRILTKEFLNTIYDRLGSHLIALRGLEGVFRNNNSLDFEEVENYSRSVESYRYFPGSMGIGFAPRIEARVLPAFLEGIRNEYYPAYQLNPAGQRNYYFPVAYISPLTPENTATIGFDMFSEKIRRDAMLSAAASGRPFLSNHVNYPGSSAELSGFYIFYPIYYEPRERPVTFDRNLNTLVGFIYTPIISKEFFQDIFKKGYEKFINLEVRDSVDGDRQILFSTEQNGENCEKCDVIEETIEVAGNNWTLKFTALPAFYSGSNKMMVFLLCSLQLGLVAVISALSYSQNKAKIKAENATRDKEELLVRERLARSQAEQASRLKEEFLATVSHELRNPLNAILGWAQIINRPNISQENVLKGIKTIEKNVHIQAKLIDDLLEMSRITTGKLILEIGDTDVVKVMDNALETVDSAVKAKKLKIVKNVEHQLPIIKADDTRLQQVIWNLLANAIKFSPEGSTIELFLRKLNGKIKFTIKDHGPGISADFLPNIFDRFRQENSKITKKHGGLGLGLAITKILIELHGGEVAVKSDGLGKGAEFSFVIPVKHAGSVLSKQKNTASEVPFGRKDIKSMSILVIDDEQDAREMLAVLINEKGGSVDCASSVDEALEKLHSRDYDLIISDIGMPEKDGYELARIIRHHQNQSLRVKPIIALSAYARENDRSLSREAGFTAHIAKPLNVSELFQTIRNLV